MTAARRVRFARTHTREIAKVANANILARVGPAPGADGWRSPCIGFPIRQLRPGAYVAAGYSGQGVALAPFAGKVIADAISGDIGRLDTFAGLPVPHFPAAGCCAIQPWSRAWRGTPCATGCEVGSTGSASAAAAGARCGFPILQGTPERALKSTDDQRA